MCVSVHNTIYLFFLTYFSIYLAIFFFFFGALLLCVVIVVWFCCRFSLTKRKIIFHLFICLPFAHVHSAPHDWQHINKWCTHCDSIEWIKWYLYSILALLTANCSMNWIWSRQMKRHSHSKQKERECNTQISSIKHSREYTEKNYAWKKIQISNKLHKLIAFIDKSQCNQIIKFYQQISEKCISKLWCPF